LIKSEPSIPQNTEEDLDAVPPVPPLPSTLKGDGTGVQDFTTGDFPRKGRSVKRSTKSRCGQGNTSSSWGDEVGPVVDLESLLNGIDTGGATEKAGVAKPPY
jgi:hypothetical protein